MGPSPMGDEDGRGGPWCGMLPALRSRGTGGPGSHLFFALPPLQRDRVISDAAEHYLALAQRLAREELPVGTAWREVEHYREKLVANKEYQWINFREQKVGHWDAALLRGAAMARRLGAQHVPI